MWDMGICFSTTAGTRKKREGLWLCTCSTSTIWLAWGATFLLKSDVFNPVHKVWTRRMATVWNNALGTACSIEACKLILSDNVGDAQMFQAWNLSPVFHKQLQGLQISMVEWLLLPCIDTSCFSPCSMPRSQPFVMDRMLGQCCAPIKLGFVNLQRAILRSPLTFHCLLVLTCIKTGSHSSPSVTSRFSGTPIGPCKASLEMFALCF